VLTYKEISDNWFYLLYPKQKTYEQFESEPGIEDREKTANLLRLMDLELPETFRRALSIRDFAYSARILPRVDAALTAETIASWIDVSDPEDVNNVFRLTISELAVFFGNLLLREHNGDWRHARFPNYFQSSVRIGDVAYFVFDTVMKRCSEDYGNETLTSKWATFQGIIAASGQQASSIS